MYAIEFVATTLFASFSLFLLNLLLFAVLAWFQSGLIGSFEERWARCVGERGLLATTRLMYRARLMRQAKGGRILKIAAALDSGILVPFLFLYSVGITAAGVYLIHLVIQSYTDTEPFRGGMRVYTVLLCLYMAYLLGPVGIMRQFSWMFRGDKARYNWPPALPLSEAHIDAVSRFDAAKAVYRLHLFERIALLAAALTAVLLWSEVLLSPNPSEEADRTFLIGLLGTAALWGCLVAFERILRSRRRRWHALDRVAAYLAESPEKPAKRPVSDASGKRRRALQGVAVAAERQARHLQAGAGPGVEHPTALLLLLSVAHLREHLSGHDSMLAAVPPEVRETLARMAVVLAGTADTAYLADTEERLHRFRDAIRSEDAPARVPRLSAGIDLTDRATGLFVKVALVVLLLWLLVSQQVAVKDLVQMLP